MIFFVDLFCTFTPISVTELIWIFHNMYAFFLADLTTMCHAAVGRKFYLSILKHLK